jgi:hypothetical protein
LIFLSSPPEGFRESLSEVPEGSLTEDPSKASVLLVFVDGMKGLEVAVPPLAKAMPSGAALWVAYTKTAYRRTDIDRDVIWSWAREMGMDAVANFSIDERWSALRLKAR